MRSSMGKLNRSSGDRIGLSIKLPVCFTEENLFEQSKKKSG